MKSDPVCGLYISCPKFNTICSFPHICKKKNSNMDEGKLKNVCLSSVCPLVVPNWRDLFLAEFVFAAVQNLDPLIMSSLP